MEQNIFDLNKKIYSNNNNILLEIVNDLQKLINNAKDDLIIKTLGNIINKMNYIINENKKNLESIRNDINILIHKFDNLNINTKNKQELKLHYGRYVGEVVNGLAEGKGIWYGTEGIRAGNRYEGDFRNNKFEGKGIYYWNDGTRYEGDWRNGEMEGKGIYYFNYGDRYEGDYRNGKAEGKGIMYWNDGDRYEGDWRNDKIEGKGIYYYNDEDYYGLLSFDGHYLNGKRDGKGKEYECGSIRFDGEYLDGRRHGKGKEYRYSNFKYQAEEYLPEEIKINKREYLGTFLIYDGDYYNGKSKWKRKTIL